MVMLGLVFQRGKYAVWLYFLLMPVVDRLLQLCWNQFRATLNNPSQQHLLFGHCVAAKLRKRLCNHCNLFSWSNVIIRNQVSSHKGSVPQSIMELCVISHRSLRKCCKKYTETIKAAQKHEHLLHVLVFVVDFLATN